MFVERTLSLALVTESWSLYLDGWPRGGTIVLPIQPVPAVTAVRFYDTDNSPTIVNSESYSVDVLSEPARLVLSAGAVQFSPARLLQCLRSCVHRGLWRRSERRAPQEVPATVAGLLLPYQRARL